MKSTTKFILAVVTSTLIGGLLFYLNVGAFNGPSNSAGVGSGAVGVNAYNNLSVGTSTTVSSTKLLVVASSTADSNNYAFKVLDSSQNILFSVRNDGTVAIGTTTLSGGSYNGTISAGNVSAGQFGSNIAGGNFSFPAALTATSGTITLASTTVNGQATSTNLSITGVASCNASNQGLQTGATGLVSCGTLSSGGSGGVGTSTAVSTNNFPFWGSLTALTGTSTLSISATTITNAGNEKIAGTFNVTSTATFASTLTQSGGLVSLASTTVAGNTTTTSLTVTGLVNGHFGVATSSVTTTACGGSTVVGSDNAGVVTMAVTTTTCTIVFASAWNYAPVCEAEVANGAGRSIADLTGTTSSLVTFGSALAATASFTYLCIGL